MLNQVNKRNYCQWSQDEKELLQRLVNQYIQNNKKPDWIEIQKNIVTKTYRQCYDQYVLLIKIPKQQNIRHDWTSEEENKLLNVFRQIPYKWEQIQTYFQYMTINQLKNKYNSLKQKDTVTFERDSHEKKDMLIVQLEQILKRCQ
ncbi:Myb-like_DNA-binding domain-containing protein [Hexamita inflata]|uniref:Myb-like_DNA-binding domain-containing protein n=1 Tax=Hexamita inflata TaxID=28002 RepID=A0ABP1HH98_9EUKA